jgi:signal peptidase I
MDLAGSLQKAYVQFAILIGTLLLYLLVKGFSPILGELLLVLILVEILVMVALEVRQGAKEAGWKHELMDTVLALIVAVAIWLSASFILNTGSPISAVVSCSMLPNLYRGDFVVLQGAQPDSYQISMTQQEFAELSRGAPTISWNNTQTQVNGSVYAYCQSSYAVSESPLCRAFISDPSSVSEVSGPFTYQYSTCSIQYTNGSATVYGPCLQSVLFHGQEYPMNLSHSIIVYKSDPGNYYNLVGDIVHRVLFTINVDGQTYYITKGDNNPITDNQVFDYNGSHTGNSPIPARNVRGKVIARIPYLGYYKLVISLYFQEDPQCSTLMSYPHVT